MKGGLATHLYDQHQPWNEVMATYITAGHTHYRRKQRRCREVCVGYWVEPDPSRPQNTGHKGRGNKTWSIIVNLWTCADFMLYIMHPYVLSAKKNLHDFLHFQNLLSTAMKRYNIAVVAFSPTTVTSGRLYWENCINTLFLSQLSTLCHLPLSKSPNFFDVVNNILEKCFTYVYMYDHTSNLQSYPVPVATSTGRWECCVSEWTGITVRVVCEWEWTGTTGRWERCVSESKLVYGRQMRVVCEWVNWYDRQTIVVCEWVNWYHSESDVWVSELVLLADESGGE